MPTPNLRPAKPTKFKPAVGLNPRAGKLVYFIQKGDGGPIKIGISSAPTLRLRSLQSANPDELRLIATIAGGAKLESELHDRFAAHHISGEWFEPHRDILDFIKGKLT